MTATVADTSPLVALHQISLLSSLRALFGVVLVPPAVAREAQSVKLDPWIEVRPLRRPIPDEIDQGNLGRGETEAIALALEVGAGRLLIDDLPARHLASSLGVPIIGTAGLLLAARRKGLIDTVRGPMDDLLRLGFRLHPDVYRKVLASAGESPE